MGCVPAVNAKGVSSTHCCALRRGETGFLNLLTAQRTYSQTNLAYLDALRELRTASAEIDGLLLANSLQAGEGP